MNKNLLPIHFAPLQGYTDAAYRQAHACIFGGIDTYYSPFVRVEHGEIRRKDIRDQPKNKERALSRLRTFIYDKEHQKYIDDIASKRKTMVSTGDRSAKIRTYNYPQGRITDHRINYTIYNLAAFMDGDIQDCIDHLIVAENAERLKESEL